MGNILFQVELGCYVTKAFYLSYTTKNLLKRIILFSVTLLQLLDCIGAERLLVPNCKPVKGNYLFAAETEVTNGQYLLFLADEFKNYGYERYVTLLPDTAQWNTPGRFNEPYQEHYFRHPAYRNYPVVNLTKKQVEAYCHWLECKLNLQYAKSTDQSIVSVDVRLPSDREWQEAARGGDENAIFPWPGSGLRNTTDKFKGQFMANFTRGGGDYMGVAGSLNDGADITAPVQSYWPNGFGLYNMAGNVAEMVQEEGRTRGGSWASRAPYLEISGIDPYYGSSKASPEIGFRYFVEVIDRRDCKEQRTKRITAKRIEKMLVDVVKDSLLVWKFEISNEWYSEFVRETTSENKPNDDMWIGTIAYARRLKNDYSTHSDYKKHPVVNIDIEQALLFCKWLTDKYNELPRRKYPALKFNLPTEREWEHMASGGINQHRFPWGGAYARNATGAWLCNINTVQERWVLDFKDSSYLVSGLTKEQIQAAGGQDGALITAPVDSYYPNAFGVKNACGNVAEMVVDKKIAKGGSWGSLIYSVGIKTGEEMVQPSPYIGFRVIAKPF